MDTKMDETMKRETVVVLLLLLGEVEYEEE
jgi:hypothetical protein